MNASLKQTLVKATPYLGILGVLAVALGCLVTALVYTGRTGEAYSPFNHFISELGEVGVSQAAAVFNIGLIVGGLCNALFLVGLSLRFSGWFRLLYGLIGLVAGLSGGLVGVFPMNRLEIHQVVALTFFNTGWIVVALFSLNLAFGRRGRYPMWLLIPGAVTVFCFIAFLIDLMPAVQDTNLLTPPAVRDTLWLVAALEWSTLIGILIWSALVSVVLLRRESAGEPSNAPEPGVRIA